ncbi:MAG: hypothetical protein NT018_05175 [Armatimonadetes bacterium]|nr:hypothetical protein [Armatimonadota bacterium]
MPHTKKRMSIKEIFYVVVVMTVTAFILSPVIAITKGASAVSNCQANLKKIGNSIKMYLADWDDTYPTNRVATGNLVPSCRLSWVGTDIATGKAYKFHYGTTWVEGLYNYMEAIVAKEDTSSVWKCPAALFAQAGVNATEKASAAVTYVFNFTLLEKPESIIRNRSKMMIVRETDRLVASVTCAVPRVNGSDMPTTGVATAPTIDSTSQIQAPFHMRPDVAIKDGSTSPVTDPTVKIHGNGSHILFADGHIKLYNAREFFKTPVGIAQANSNWDYTDSAFYNYINTAPAYQGIHKAIQITP